MHTTRTRTRRGLGVTLLLLPVVALSSVPIYARDGPRLFEIPFFYWYQIAWVALSMVCMAAAALLIPIDPRTHRTHDSEGRPQ